MRAIDEILAQEGYTWATVEDAGTSWPRPDVHEPGPEEVFVVSGTFNDGARDHPAGTFVHAPAGSWHLPRTTTGCTLFLFYPEG